MSEVFRVTPECATDMAQLAHNETEENGEINQDKILDAIHEQLSDELGEWLEEHVNWDKILDDDRETREFVKERNEAMRGGF